VARVLVECPVAHRPVFTGQRMTEARFEVDAVRYGFRCAACGDIHHWERADAWLERSGARPGSLSL